MIHRASGAPTFSCRVLPDTSCVPCVGARFGNLGGGIARLIWRVRGRSARLRISMARAARVDVPRAGCRGRGGERRDRDCDMRCLGRGCSGAFCSDSDTMCDACDASLYKNTVVPASSDTLKPKNRAQLMSRERLGAHNFYLSAVLLGTSPM